MIPLSVIIPFYNSAPYLRRTVKSLLNQSLKDIEFIFVNDGSTDGSKDIISNLKASHNSFNIILADSSSDGKNNGISKARQTGLNLAKGEYVTFCDSDDWLDMNYYLDLYTAAKRVDADIVVGDYCVEKSDCSERILAPEIKNWKEFKEYPKWFHLSLWNRLIKLSLIRDNNITFFEGVNFSEDYGFVLISYFYSKRNYHINSDSLYHYNKQNDNSLTTSLSSSCIYQRIRCLQLIDSLFDSKGGLDDCNIHVLEKFNAKDALLSIDEFEQWAATFPKTAILVLKDPERNWLYKIFYLMGQHLSWRLLWFYHRLHKILR